MCLPLSYAHQRLPSLSLTRRSIMWVEGQSLSVMVSVRSGVTLERDVVVTLMTVDDSATGNVRL